MKLKHLQHELRRLKEVKEDNKKESGVKAAARQLVRCGGERGASLVAMYRANVCFAPACTASPAQFLHTFATPHSVTHPTPGPPLLLSFTGDEIRTGGVCVRDFLRTKQSNWVSLFRGS